MVCEYWTIAGAMILPNLGGLLNRRRFTKANLDNWCDHLNFPSSYRPVNWVFEPVSLSLYSGIAYASYLVWKDGGGFKDASLPLAMYCGQLAMNWAGSPLFLKTHNIKETLVNIAALATIASISGILFVKVNKTAGFIFYSICCLVRFCYNEKLFNS